MCRNHYMMWWKYGRTERLPELSEEERFWAKVEKTDTCWIWRGTQKRGRSQTRGSFRPTGPKNAVHPVLPHRWAYEHLVGPIPTGFEIDHICYNSLCVRPEHLQLATHSDNARRGGGGKLVYIRATHADCPICLAFLSHLKG